MGIALWSAGGLAAWLVARAIRSGRRWWLSELLLALLAALLLGLVATALDFGGWKTPDWRAGLFAFFGVMATLGCFRLVTVRRVQ